LHDPHLASVDFFAELNDDALGQYRGLRHPVGFSKTPASIRSAPPALGQDNDEILKTSRNSGNSD
jgi:crotonobetainyl-CoA:carnitine CoA-transferase CaiB-like acyl-CoA transferase